MYQVAVLGRRDLALAEEAMQIGDIDKTLRRPGDISQAVKTEEP